MKTGKFFRAALVTFLLASDRFVPAADLPGLVVPEGLGVNIHFTDPKPGEMDMLSQGGFRWVRMDFAWDATERERGRYDFSAYDRLGEASYSGDVDPGLLQSPLRPRALAGK